MPSLLDLGEDAIVSELILPRFPQVVEEGYAADDCAVSISPQKGLYVHTLDPGPTPVVCELFDNDLFHLGWLTVTVNASDIAAMGATPDHLLLSVEAPGDMQVDDFERLLDGVASASKAMQVKVTGGNIRDASQLRVLATMVGIIEDGEPLRRGAGRPGQTLWAIGPSGHFWLSILTCLQDGLDRGRAIPEIEAALFRPMPLVSFARELRLSGLATMATDASDGVMAAVQNVAMAAGCSAEVEVSKSSPDNWAKAQASRLGVDVRACAFAWGDWQIVTAIDPESTGALEALAAKHGLHAMYCGNLVQGTSGETRYLSNGNEFQPPELRSKKFSKANAGWQYIDWANLIRTATMG